MHNLKIHLLSLSLFLVLLSCGSAKIKGEKSSGTTDLYSVIQYGPDSCHARGIFLLNDVLYTANSNGHIYQFDLKSKKSKVINQLPLVELRDIAVFDNGYIIAMQSADSSCLFLDSGTEKQIFTVSNKASFYDGIAINERGYGILMGDPIDGIFQIFKTSDFGKSWIPCMPNIKAVEGEAGYAASGTNVQVLNDSTYMIVTGGKENRLLKTTNYAKNWSFTKIPFDKKDGSGPFSMYFKNANEGVVVGGNYSSPADTNNNCFVTYDGGKTWKKPLKTTGGYRSCVIMGKSTLYACGSNGIDYSTDFGLHWNSLCKENTLALFVYKGKVYATSTKGRVLVFDEIE